MMERVRSNGRPWQTVAHRGRRNADESLAAELAAGKTVREAATAAGVSERTAHRRTADPAFKARVTDLRTQMVTRASGRLADGMTAAADVLRKLLTSKTESIRLRAAERLIELGLKVTELAELQQRVEELERRLEGANR
jgi:hypothetical protein